MLKSFGLTYRDDSFIGDETPTWETIKTFDSHIYDKDGNGYLLIPKSGCSQLASFCTGVSLNDNDLHNVNWNTIKEARQLNTAQRDNENLTIFIRHPIHRFISMCNFVCYFKNDNQSPHYVSLYHKDKSVLINKVLTYCTIANNLQNIDNVDIHLLSQYRFIGRVLDKKYNIKLYKLEYLKTYFGQPDIITANSMYKFVTINDLNQNQLEQLKYTFFNDIKLYNSALNPNEK